MDDYKFEQRKKKRGGRCIFAAVGLDGVERSHLCGCGVHDEVNKKQKRRIVKRALKQQLYYLLKDL